MWKVVRRVSMNRLTVAATLVIAAVGVATVAQATSGGGTDPTEARTHTVAGAYVANAAVAALASHDATKVSRSATRPAVLPVNNKHTTLPVGKKNAIEADRQALARYIVLRRAADNAEKFAKRLSSNQWVAPTINFRLTALFGEAGPYWASGYHTGVDFAAAYGTPVVAVGNGTVVQTGWAGPYGNQIRLQLPNGDQVWYNHLSAIGMTVGMPVLKGQELGRVGDTGNAYGYHLHLEYRLAADLSTAIDPLPVLLDHGLSVG